MLLILLASIISLASSKPAEELVVALPEMETFPYGVYSGFVPLSSGTKELYYLLAESQNDWKTDPLLIWFQGGPGCSSMYGFTVENGPWVMKPGNTSFERNEYAWNKNASVLYIDQPAGVGYSFCDATLPPKGGCDYDDDKAGAESMEFLLGWYAKFPEFKDHKLFISGESYAGIYVPFLADQIVTYNEKNTTDPAAKIPLDGFMVGNGCTNWTYDCMPATVNVTYGRGIIDGDIFNNMTENRCDYSGFEFGDQNTQVCTELLDRAADVWAGLDTYNLYRAGEGIDTRMCSKEENDEQMKQLKEGKPMTTPRRPFAPYKFTGDYAPWAFRQHKAKSQKPLRTCVGGDPLTSYFNNALVRQALHIPAKIQPWADCSDIEYVEGRKGSQFVWEALKGKVRMLKYSGDKDGNVPAFGTLGWINALNRKELSPWRAWLDAEATFGANQVGGYFWQLDGLDFATVHGAGHMVPLDQGKRALQLFNNWMAGRDIDPNWSKQSYETKNNQFIQ